MTRKHKFPGRFLAGFLILLVCAFAYFFIFSGKDKVQLPDYQLISQFLVQPLDHDNPSGDTFEQEILIIKSDSAGLDAPVFFILGNESDATPERLITIYQAYGAPENVIFITAEHRGYGQSISKDADQSAPSYVTIEQALDDYHRVVTELKKEYTGPWMAAGYSYGGGLVIHYAHRFPEDVQVILASSAVVDWPFYMAEYDRQVKINLGDELYNRLAGHIRNLTPDSPFDETWYEREFLTTGVIGLSQYQSYQSLVPLFNVLSRLPTKTFVTLFRLADTLFAKGYGWKTAQSFGKQGLSREEALTGEYNWYTWKYQQCFETGTFWVSEEAGGLFPKSEVDILEECRFMFGVEAPASTNSQWNPRAMIAELTVPQVYVVGGRDPWKWLGILQQDYQGQLDDFFFVPDGYHCPDKDDLELGKRVLSRMLYHVNQ